MRTTGSTHRHTYSAFMANPPTHTHTLSGQICGQWRGQPPSSVKTDHRAVTQRKSGGSTGTTITPTDSRVRSQWYKWQEADWHWSVSGAASYIQPNTTASCQSPPHPPARSAYGRKYQPTRLLSLPPPPRSCSSPSALHLVTLYIGGSVCITLGRANADALIKQVCAALRAALAALYSISDEKPVKGDHT